MDSKLKKKRLKIEIIKARETHDSRKRPTLQVLIKLDDFLVSASVPSGASTGKYEAKVIEVEKAIKNINEIIAPQLVGKEPTEQKEIDNFLLKLDGTKDKSKLGGNAVVGVSMVISRAGAVTKKTPLYLYLREIYRGQTRLKISEIFPRPCFNIINGGMHAKNDLDIQEFMIVPQLESFSENFALATKIYKNLGKIIQKKFKKLELGDEGGFSPPISKATEALDLIGDASDNFKNTKIILDCAASQFQKGEKYKIEKRLLSKRELLDYYCHLIEKYPIIGLEDPFGEEDFEGWELLNYKLQMANDKFLLISDDLTVTNPERIKIAKEKGLCNGVIIKINQIGTVTEAIEAVKLAKSFGWKIIVSHRSGETLDPFIADFAVGVGADFIKSGAPARSERLAKYNRLLEIERG